MRRFVFLSLSIFFVATGCGSEGGTTPGDASADAPVETGPADAALDVQAVPVTGKVVDEVGAPVVGAVLRIGGATATTDSNGGFTLPAGATYDVVVAAPSRLASTKKVTAFRALTTRTPTLQTDSTPRRVAGGDWTWSVSGTGFPQPANTEVILAFAPASPAFLGGLRANNTTTTFSNKSWDGPATVSGSTFSYRLTTDPVTGMPTSFTHAGSGSFTVDTVGAKNFAASLTAGVVTATLAVTIVPGGTTLEAVQVATSPVAGSRYWWLKNQAGLPLSFTATLPSGGAATASVLVLGSSSSGYTMAWRHLLKASGAKFPDTTLTLFPGPSAMAPANNATGVGPNTTFSWTALPNAAYAVSIRCGATAPYSYISETVTMATSMTLPDTSGLGVSLAPGSSCSWYVNAFTVVTNADALVGPGGYRDRSDPYWGTEDGTRSLSGNGSFTSQ